MPYVIETSIGLDRMFLAVLSHSFGEEELENGDLIESYDDFFVNFSEENGEWIEELR